ncbi:MAG: guanylate kinase [Clostridia bacterium]|nr:guanylate kinase [Clostridia bacterium]
MNNKKGVLAVVSGPSGCGKGTVLSYVLKDENYGYSISATTRDPREGEKDGVHYFFISKEEFLTRVEKGRFLEHAEYCNNYYGTPRDYVEELLEKGKNVILEIETKGALMVKENAPDALLIFIAPPDMETLENRLRGRGTEDEDTVRRRLAKAAEEMTLIPKYDLCIVNGEGQAEKAAADIMSAINAYRNA